MAKKNYDLIFSLGEACSSTQALIKANLRIASYPFDWLFGSNFLGRVHILVSEFKDFLNKEDLVSLSYHNGDLNNLCNVYKNTHTQLTLNHDFSAHIPFEKSYPQVLEKYNRRIRRLLNNLKNATSILIVFIETPTNSEHTSDHDIILGYQQILKKYPNKHIDLLYIQHDLSFSPSNYQTEELSKNIIKITANYKKQKQGVPPYAVENRILKKFLNQYRLNIPVSIKIKKIFLCFLIKCLPIKSIRKKLKRKYHV